MSKVFNRFFILISSFFIKKLVFIFVVWISSASYVIAVGVEILHVVFLITIKVFVKVER